MVYFLARLVKLGLLSGRDGWRRATGLLLREEPARFVLTAFGLDLGTGNGKVEQRTAARLAQFLRSEPLARTWMDCGPRIAVPRPSTSCDVTHATFAPTGALECIELCPDPAVPLPSLEPAERARLDTRIIEAYNGTRNIAPLVESGREHHRQYIQRVVCSTFLSFVPMPSGPARFRMPDFLQRRHPGFGLFNIICRVSADGRQADLWVQVHHAGTDGLPVQELLSRLEQEWGVCSPIHFPTPEEFAALSVPELCSPPGAARDIYHLHDFVDFAPLLALRKQVNERLAGQIGAEVTLGGLLLWALMHDPTLLGGTCLATVEVPASMDEERSVNFVGIRPGDFIRPADRMAGFVRFAQEFNARVVETRERRSNLYLATSATASMPVGLHAWLMHWNLGRPGFHTPTLGLSLVRDAKVVVSPMGDIGFADGFIAIGNLSLPTAGAQAVGCVSIKGTRDRVEVLRSAMRQAIVRCREYV